MHPLNYAPLKSFLDFRVRYRPGARTRSSTLHETLMEHLEKHFPERVTWFPRHPTATVDLFRMLGFERVKNSVWFFRDMELLPEPEPQGPSPVDPWPWKKA
jgi:hypothetical protein